VVYVHYFTDICPHWQPAIAVIIVQFVTDVYLVNKLSFSFPGGLLSDWVMLPGVGLGLGMTRVGVGTRLS